MLKSKEMSQNEYEFISNDELVPENHLLRLIDKQNVLSFI
jgi:transposase